MNGNPAKSSARERDVFLQALEQPTPADRAAFLNEACGDDPSLRASVESLLRNHQNDAFLETPAVEAPRVEASGRGPAGTAAMALGTGRPGDRIGRYKLLQEIGEGGVGTVFMAEQEEPVRRRVALKVIKPGMDTRSIIARFEAERQALALMDHPNIAKVLDAGATDSGRPYFVMELVRGIRITDYCDQNHLPTRERLLLFIKVCQAIQHAHQKGIIHRDVKPSNILVTLHDGVPVPKIIDFGIAKAIDQRLTDKTVFTQFQAFIGTPAYMSPEQAEMSGLDVDTRTDVYGLGVLLYEMLTGRTPFDPQELLDSGLDGMRRTIREREPLTPSTLLDTMLDAERTTTARRQQSEPARLASLIRGDLDWIVMKALEKDRTRRYDTANDLAMDVQRHLSDEPILARPPSRLYRFQKLVRRNKLAAIAAGAVAAALVLGLALSTWQYLEKSSAYQRVLAAEAEQRVLREAAQQAQATEAQLRRQAEAQELAARRRAYAADMNLVQQALAANNLGRAQEVLNAHRPLPGQTDLRGWEWRYLWQHCQSDALFTLCQRSNEIQSLAVSHDGRWAAVAEANGDVSVWDLRTRQAVERWSSGGGRVAICFSPTEALLAFNTPDHTMAPGGPPGMAPGPPPPSSSSPDASGPPRFGPPRQRVRLWDATTRQLAGDVLVAGSCQGLAFSPDGQTLMTLTPNGVTLWRVSDRTQLEQVALAGSSSPGMGAGGPPQVGRGGLGSSVQASRDLSLAAFALPKGKITLLDLSTGQERWTVQAADEEVMALAFSPDSKVLASGAGFVESAIRLWDVTTGTEIARLEGHRTFVSALVFWPDGKTLASASGDQTVRLWDVADLGSLPIRAEPMRREVQRPPPQRGGMFSRERPPRPRMINVRPLATLRGHKLEVWSLALLPDNTTLISGSKDGSVCVWDTTALRRDATHFKLPAGVRAAAFAADSQSILALDREGQVVRWQGSDFQERQVLIDLGTNVLNLLFSEGGRWVATAAPRSPIRVWDLETQTLLHEFTSTEGPAFPVAFLPRSDHLVIRHIPAGLFREWEVTTGHEVRSWRSAPAPGFGGMIACSADGQWFVELREAGKGRLRNLANGQETDLDLDLKQLSQVAFSPDGKLLAAASRLGSGGVWDTGTTRRVAALHGFLQGMSSTAFSPDGTRLAIGGDGNEAIKLWDAESFQELLTLEGEGSIFLSTSFSPDGSLLGSRNSQGTLHLWRAPSLEEIGKLEAHSR
jgi:WD40 repeat protein/serine/threonine protein kinase